MPGPSWFKPCPNYPRHNMIIGLDDGSNDFVYLCDLHFQHLWDLGAVR